MRGRYITIAATLLGSAGSASAADQQPICPTRPGKSTAPCTVPEGHFQLETSIADWSLQKVGAERDTMLFIGQTALKYGLTDLSDVEVTVTPWERSTSREAGVRSTTSGFGDLIVSYKHQLNGPTAAVQLTLLSFVKVPTARHGLGNGKWEGGLLIPVAYALPKTPLSLNFTPEVDLAANASGSGHHAAMQQVASLGVQISPKLSVSAELWERWDWDPSGTTRQSSADGSVALLLSNNVQLDAGGNLGLNRNTPDVELYTGVSVRF